MSMFGATAMTLFWWTSILIVAPGLRADELEQLYQDIGQELQKELGINHITLQAEYERGRKDKMIVPGHGINED